MKPIVLRFHKSSNFPWFSITKNGKFLWRATKKICGGSRVVFFCNAGPMMKYNAFDGVLLMEDLNPQQEMRWGLSRFEAVKLGLSLIKEASRP